VLDTDIVAHPERIAGAGVVATMLAGRWVHGRPPWWRSACTRSSPSA